MSATPLLADRSTPALLRVLMQRWLERTIAIMTVFPFLAFALLVGLAAITEAKAQTRQDKAAIRRAVETMTLAFNSRDDQATASVTTPDADFVTVTGYWSKGVGDYIAARRARFRTALKNASIRTVDTEIRFLRPDVALVHVLHEISGMLDANGNELPPHQELSLRVFVKERDKWLMAAFHNTTVAVPATPPGK